MERESFSSHEVADILNTSFIPIKVDRESRPDIDEIYMNYVSATTGHGGWPLNVFLTPDLKPVFGGTYWPGPNTSSALTRRASNASEQPLTFQDILERVQEAWETQRDRCLADAADITDQLQAFAAEGIHSHSSVHVRGADTSEGDPFEPLELELIDDAFSHFVSRYDSTYGGFSAAPKFPTPTTLTFLLRIGASINHPSTHTRFGFPPPVPDIIGERSCATAAQMALHTLLAMSRSGTRDHLGHGFHRYSVTRDWNLPHFEKMLYDNTQLLGSYCDAWALGRNPEVLGTIYSLVEYFTNADSPIVRPEGGWYSSEDADSHASPSSGAAGSHDEKKEGSYYVWTYKEFQQILGERDATILARHFGVKPDGNVPAEYDVHDEMLSQNVLHIAATPSVLAKEFGVPEDNIVKIVKSGKAKLAEYRNTQRGRPDVDTKIIAAWNGLAIINLCRAAHTLTTIDSTRAKRCREAAEKGAAFLLSSMYDSTTGRLTRVYNISTNQEDQNTAFVDDYAYLTLAAISLYDLTASQKYLDWAVKLQSYLDAHFLANTSGGYFQAASSPEQIMRLKPGTDNTTPSPNGLVASNLLYLASYDQDNAETYIQKARSVLDAFAVEIIQHPFLYVSLLSAMVMEQVGVKSLLVPIDMDEKEAMKLKGWGRTVVRTGGIQRVMICEKETKVCRELRDGELQGEWEDLSRGETPFDIANKRGD